MEFRSTNDNGWIHRQGDIVTNVSSGGPINSSHGVHLTGGSSGGIVQGAGDEAAVALRVRGKGTGPLILGSTSASVAIGSDSTNSTSFLSSIQRFFVQYTVPALSSGPFATESTVTVAGLSTAGILILQNRIINNSTAAVDVRPRCSTANELTILFANESVSSLSGSTQSAYLLQFAF